ncbi:S8 family peptidase [Nocardioides marmorisolisilvae]|uniref:Peptidase S8 and S53 subtilisin kexin sedolisin n=1 Tax=Nocardioides marmorisolisilvae TaxID=1542737 RepID=A0A3N0DWI2_9ACTN|nr:S8 family serine peptidase [Nocardioides marmorisolisilvae]RNL79974.1 peptidase S8 and S53 subtilisin kexin sedolisin [Nocardioides marmorisolisilvae]
MVGIRVRRAALVVGVVAATAAASTSLANTAASSPPTGAHRFVRVAHQAVTDANVFGLSNKPVTVMVQTSGDAITVAQAKAGHKLSKSEKAAIRSNLENRQAGVEKQVRAKGGKVGASYQNAYNGFKVTIASKKAASLADIPGVVGVRKLTPKSFDNIHGVPLIGAPAAWDGVNGFNGTGIKIGIIDTGIDYTHADFGGPGTVSAYQAALATDDQAPNPALFGPAAPRVKGGTDLVGDSYNADPTDPALYQPVPHPDSNPLDCTDHGTHVAGTAAGSGVLANGSTYNGTYNATTVANNSWKVGPGVAPKADLYAIRVFGCAGSTDVVVDAIEWAVDHGMNVINMSLGSPFGGPDDPDAVAVDNATAAGTIVVTSSGNEGPNPYMTGSPGSATSTISVAAEDATPSYAGVDLALPGGHVQAILANDVAANGLSAPIKVLYNPGPHTAANISLGCDPAEYTAANVTGTIVVVKRGTCARVARAIFGQQAGAAAVVMVNNVDALPPAEGQITSNPDTGVPYDVTIPFLGVKSSDAGALVAADGAIATTTDNQIANPTFLGTASFSSAGPRSGDSALKPDVTAAGVSVVSAGMGTGNGPATISGTSMASPHVAGAAALVRQAHPTWGKVAYWKAALVNTGDPTLVSDYSTRSNGTGAAQVQKAVKTQVIATAADDGTATLSYGFADLAQDFSRQRLITLRNFGSTAVTFKVTHLLDAGSPHTFTSSMASVTVPAKGTKSFGVTLKVPAKTVGDATDFRDASGIVRLTPTTGQNGNVALSMAYYLVPRADSNLKLSLNMTTLKTKHTSTASITNNPAPIAGNADWYAWGTSDVKEADLGSDDIRATGVQTFPDDGVLAFGISTYKRWSNAAANEFDTYVDVDGDGNDDYVVVVADEGQVTAGDANGVAAVFVFNLATGEGTEDFLADAPTDSQSMAVPVLFDQLCDPGSPCLTAGSGKIRYYTVSFGPDGTTDAPEQMATFNVLHPAISTGMFNTVAPYKTVKQVVTLDPAQYLLAPPKGVMVMSHDNRSDLETATLALP